MARIYGSTHGMHRFFAIVGTIELDDIILKFWGPDWFYEWWFNLLQALQEQQNKERND